MLCIKHFIQKINSVQVSTVQLGAVKLSVVKLSVVQFSAMQLSVVQLSALQLSAVQCSWMQMSAVECSVTSLSAGCARSPWPSAVILRCQLIAKLSLKHLQLCQLIAKLSLKHLQLWRAESDWNLTFHWISWFSTEWLKLGLFCWSTKLNPLGSIQSK